MIIIFLTAAFIFFVNFVIVNYSSERSGRENKEVLVQHLLVNESDVNLLIELQEKTARGLF